VPFSKRKSRRSPLQRLNDQRRSLALAGLALGAVFGAAIFRRSRRGQEGQVDSAERFEGPAAAVQPEPAEPVDSGPTPVVDVPPPADEPELDDARPINAAPVAESVPPASPTGDPASDRADAASDQPDAPSPPEPATGELSAAEASILSVLAQAGRSDDDRTAIAVATSLERDTRDVTDVLRKLGAEGVVSGELYTASGEKIWAVTERGVRRLGAQS
jgi:hypothetical protein